MITLPPEFEKDIQGQNLNLYPIVSIGQLITKVTDSEVDLTRLMETHHNFFEHNGMYTLFSVGDYVKIDSEYMRVVNFVHQHIIVARGLLGSDIAYHVVGTDIYMVDSVEGGLDISTKALTLPIYPDLDLPWVRNYKPLLLNIPSIKESMDFENRKYKISNVTLKISNFEYEGERFSDYAGNLINESVIISWVSQSESILEVYSGFIRRYFHDDETVTLQLEDSSQKDLHKDVPIARLGDGDDVLDKYKLKPIPMVYGEVDYSPCIIPEILNGEAETSSFNIIPDRTVVIGDNQVIAIDNMIRDNQYYGSTFAPNITIYTYTDKYIGILDSPFLQGFTATDGFFEDMQINRTPSEFAQYATANRSMDDPEDSESSLNTIASNIAFVYEKDDKVSAIKFHDTGSDETAWWLSPMPSLDFIDEDLNVMFYVETNPSHPNFGLPAVKQFVRTTISYSQVSDEMEDEIRRERFHVGDDCSFTAFDTIAGALEFYFHCYIDEYEPAWIDPPPNVIKAFTGDGVYTGDNSWHSQNVVESFGQTQWVVMFEAQNYSRTHISQFKMLNSWIEKYYYIDKFQTRDFYAHVKGRTLAAYESTEE